MTFTDYLQLLVLLDISLVAQAAVQQVELNIVNANIAPDGFERQTVLAGGTFPGQLITGNKGDEFQINVVNQLHDLSMLKSTSIHWHGIFQHGTNWADGPAFINQCPIAANNSFLYDFTVPDQAGTFWYHSHLRTQYCDGLRGPLVIYDPEDPYLQSYDVDDESTVLTLGDWYHTPAPEIVGVATPSSALLNGAGRYPGGPNADLAVVTVTSQLRYRMRLVSASCDSNYIFSIDNHNMTIIEVDGVNHKTLTVDSMQIFASQRYSFILTADQSVDNYWIRFKPNNGNTTFINNMNMAILRYVGAAVADPTSVQTTSVAPLVETNLIPLVNPTPPGEPFSGGVDTAYNLVLGFAAPNFEINGVTFVPPTVPVLLQILSGTTNAADLIPSGSLYALPSNSSIELSFQTSGVAGQPHPFHLHGHTFSVVRSAGTTEYNYVNPVQRDVVSTGAAGDNVTIRFQTDNAGPWFLHCHIDWHLDLGFAVVMVEDAPQVAASNPVPADWSQLCPIYDNLTSSQL